MEKSHEYIPVGGTSGKHIPHDAAHPALTGLFRKLIGNHAHHTAYGKAPGLYLAHNRKDKFSNAIIEFHRPAGAPVMSAEIFRTNALKDCG